MLRLILSLFLLKVALTTGEVYFTKLLQNPQDNYKCVILEQNTIRKFKGFETTDVNELKIFVKPALSAPADSMLDFQDDSQIFEIYAKSLNMLEVHVDTICLSKETVPAMPLEKATGPEIQKIVDGGNPANRIDVVFMGDGYTAAEHAQFFSDIRRLTADMFNGLTFKSYLPVFNVWAIYVESVDSGIGYNGARNTPFRLYRQAGQLRGVYTGNAAYARQVCQLTGPSGCDYPSLIGNDNYYGGLGGEFVISTKSERTGTVVLRHEMGHNFINVGEEYDNGQVYSGVNSAATLALVDTRWGHWLSSNTVRAERVIYRLLEYPWADLSVNARSFNFNSDGQYSRWYLQASVSAAGQADSLEFVLDGVVLPWQSRGSDDREFYSWSGNQGFSQGQHTFTVRSRTTPTNPDIPRMICNVVLHEFGNENEFVMNNDHYSAYPTWDVSRRVTYRPTNAGCLMRNMTHNELCSVCKEGMWYQFLRRISLIDEIIVNTVVNPDQTRHVVLHTLRLGQLRDSGSLIPGERLEIRWSHSDQLQTALNDRFDIYAQAGSWSVSVRFVTPEVRSDPSGLLFETENFTVTI